MLVSTLDDLLVLIRDLLFLDVLKYLNSHENILQTRAAIQAGSDLANATNVTIHELNHHQYFEVGIWKAAGQERNFFLPNDDGNSWAKATPRSSCSLRPQPRAAAAKQPSELAWVAPRACTTLCPSWWTVFYWNEASSLIIMRRRPSSSQPLASAASQSSNAGSFLPVEETQQQLAQLRTYPIILNNDNVKNEPQPPLPPAQPPPPVPVPPGNPLDSACIQDDKAIGDKPMIIQPPLPPQHVYAPMPALGALSIGFLSKKKEKKEDADFRLITNGISLGIGHNFPFPPTLNHMNCSIAI